MVAPASAPSTAEPNRHLNVTVNGTARGAGDKTGKFARIYGELGVAVERTADRTGDQCFRLIAVYYGEGIAVRGVTFDRTGGDRRIGTGIQRYDARMIVRRTDGNRGRIRIRDDVCGIRNVALGVVGVEFIVGVDFEAVGEKVCAFVQTDVDKVHVKVALEVYFLYGCFFTSDEAEKVALRLGSHTGEGDELTSGDILKIADVQRAVEHDVAALGSESCQCLIESLVARIGLAVIRDSSEGADKCRAHVVDLLYRCRGGGLSGKRNRTERCCRGKNGGEKFSCFHVILLFTIRPRSDDVLHVPFFPVGNIEQHYTVILSYFFAFCNRFFKILCDFQCKMLKKPTCTRQKDEKVPTAFLPRGLCFLAVVFYAFCDAGSITMTTAFLSPQYFAMASAAS